MDISGKRDMVVIWYDPAKLGDNAAFIVFDPKTFEVIDEHIMKWVPYMEQKIFLKQLKEQHYNSIVVMDRSWVWEWVYEIFQDLVDCSVRYKSSGDVRLAPLGYWLASKWEIVDTLRMYIENYWIKISDHLENIIKEFKHFKALTDRGRVIQYGWVWFTDDSVNALALVTFYLKHVSSVTSPIDFWIKNHSIELDQYGNVVDPDIPYTSLLESYDYEDTYKQHIY